MKNEELSKEVEDLRDELEEITVQNRFGLQRFAGSDEDIRFYTRFATYNHLMAFWQLIEPATHQLIRVTSSKVTREEGPSRKQTIGAVNIALNVGAFDFQETKWWVLRGIKDDSIRRATQPWSVRVNNKPTR
ncbi:hypothetical protein SKAU_G00061430 [Synaphobranchus kaupii]|uniref:Uncharacterized protein n=1 Tax=Synaphobranchus kaupii TaxID=118154 RepID=A0A9Q1G4W4_SYNKA|nr:hypothetical protein SKAU_G00061430 [Synaphobranchus kaupii]